MNNLNSPALFRSLIVYAVCVPLAVTVGYLLTDFQDYDSMGFIGVLIAILIFPLLMKWHYPLLIFSWASPITLFFLPGKPNLFIFMVVVSLSISVVESILNREKRFVPAGGVRWTLLALLLVVFITAKLTGGFGLRSMGSNVYGGKKYVTFIIGILSFFAIAARPIPKHKANLYMLLFLAGGFLGFIADIYIFIPEPLRFISLIIPPSDRGLDEMGNMQVEFGVTRLFGVAGTAGAVLLWLLARYGIRETFLSGKLWRPVVFGLCFILTFLGGFRSTLLSFVMLIGLLFVLEKLHRSILMLPMILLGIMGSVALVPLAPHLPYTFQRTLAFLPLNIDPAARVDAEGSTQWRLDIWAALMPQVPQYLLLGKGYSFSAETFNEFMGRDATFRSIDAGNNALALSNDFHSGPLSVVISFGIWGVLAWLAYWVAGFRVVWRNYKYGDPQLRHLNIFLFASLIGKCLVFLFIFGAISEDVAGFAGIIGLSLALNHGVARPQPQPQAAPAAAKARLPLPARPALQS
jgi:hypothetical protein